MNRMLPPTISTIKKMSLFGAEEADPGMLPKGRITNDYLKKLCKSKGGYMTENLNEKLYLQHRGVSKIENLEKFSGLKVIWLEANAIHEIEGLDNQKALSCLYIHQNCIEQIKGIFHCTNLHTLNVSENFISHIPDELGQSCPNIQTFDISGNHLKTIKSVRGLAYCTKLNVLDLSKNKLFEDLIDNMTIEETIQEFMGILSHMTDLRLLKLEGNEFIRKFPHYRKEIIAAIPTLTYLDSMPVFEDERRTVMAWKRGGLDEEREERQRINQEKRDKEKKNYEAFEKMIQKSRENYLRQKEEELKKQSENELLEETPQTSTNDTDEEQSSSEQVQGDSTNDEEQPLSEENPVTTTKEETTANSEPEESLFDIE